jgi:hypothetical protein
LNSEKNNPEIKYYYKNSIKRIDDYRGALIENRQASMLCYLPNMKIVKSNNKVNFNDMLRMEIYRVNHGENHLSLLEDMQLFSKYRYALRNKFNR